MLRSERSGYILHMWRLPAGFESDEVRQCPSAPRPGQTLWPVDMRPDNNLPLYISVLCRPWTLLRTCARRSRHLLKQLLRRS